LPESDGATPTLTLASDEGECHALVVATRSANATMLSR